MIRFFLLVVLSSMTGAFLSSHASAADEVSVKEALVDDVPRSKLAEYSAKLTPGRRTFPRQFEIPLSMKMGRVYGIDISHYQGQVNWVQLLATPLQFVFVKASQGSRSYDGQFSKNWASLHAQPRGSRAVRRGAYHFLTALDDPASQAENFISVVGEFDETDLPPTVDLEWDWQVKDSGVVADKQGVPFDRWARFSPREILNRLNTWIVDVERHGGKKPIVYTSLEWWNQRIGDPELMARYSIWLADYRSISLGRESPSRPSGTNWMFWQFTDRGWFAGQSDLHLDVDIFSGEPSDFERFLTAK